METAIPPAEAPLAVARLLADRPLSTSAQRTTVASTNGVVPSTAPGPGRAAAPLVEAAPALPRRDSPHPPPARTALAVPDRPALHVMRAAADPAAAAPPDPGSGGWTSVDIPAAAPPEVPAAAAGPDGSSPQTATTSPPPVPPPPPVAPEELLKTLFEPLYRRLRAELRKDRDRRGLITDLRR